MATRDVNLTLKTLNSKKAINNTPIISWLKTSGEVTIAEIIKMTT